MSRKVLIPALIDAEVKIPLEFRRLQAADLSRWHGEDSPEFRQFCEAVARNVAAAPGPRVDPPVVPPVADVPRPPVSPAPPAKAKSTRTLWIGGGIALLVLAGIASMVPERDGGGQMPAAQQIDPPLAVIAPPLSNGATMPNAGAGLNATLSWRDHALTYNGKLSWDGRSNMAQLSVNVFDTATRKSLGQRQVVAYGRADAPGRNVFSTQVVVPGDSVTAGTHTHTVNLVFEAQANGDWAFVRNCSAPNDCYEVRH